MISIEDMDMENYLKQRYDFDNFLANHKIRKDEEKIITHTCYGKPYGSYHIPDNEYNKFLILYKKIACKKDDLHIIERHNGKNVGPLIIDIDYWVKGKHKERKYRQDHIETLISISTKIINKYLKVKKNDIEILVMEKKKPSYDKKKNQYKDGFHLVYSIPMSVKMRYFIYDKIKEKSKSEDIFDDIPFINENAYDEIFDMSVVYNNGLTMYGSRKENSQTYYLSLVYDHETKQKKLNYDPDELVILCSLRRFFDDDELTLKDDTNEINKQIEEVYEKYHSKKEKNKEQNKEQNKEIKEKTKDKMREKINGLNEKDNKKNKNGDTNMAKKLLKVLSKNRALNYHEWIHVGWALHNIDHELLGDYIEFSKQSSKWQEGCCEKIWENAKNDDEGLTIASIHWWAQIDNSEKYKEIIRESINKLVMDAETGTHDDIAKIVLEMYKHKYRCASIKKNIWYEFQGHRWVNVDSGYTLAMKLSDEISKEYLSMASVHLSQSSLSNGHDNEACMQKAKNVFKIVEKLKNQEFKRQVISASSHRFHEISKNFEELLDSNPNLIGFDNGVFDLEQGCFKIEHKSVILVN